jgi:hypothetical protein
MPPRPEVKAPADPSIELTRDPQGDVVAFVHDSGRYAWTTAGGATHQFEVAALPAPVKVDGPWQVTFDPKNGGPDRPVTFAKLEDWTKRSEEGVRNYSGVAVYRTTFDLAATSKLLELDLGDVQSIARVRVNGHEIGTLWKRPYCIDVTAAARAGKNSLEIEVVNTWLNRLLGDDQPGVAKRWTFGTTKTWGGSPLPSGLLGPVTIRSAERIITPGVQNSGGKSSGTARKEENKSP